MPPSICTHRVTTAPRRKPASVDPTRCQDCGAQLAGRELRPAWEHAIGRGDPDRFPPAWGFGEATSWLYSELSAYSSSGRLDRALLDGNLPGVLVWGDLWLDAAIAANTARIVELAKLVEEMGKKAPPALSDADRAQLPPSIHEMRLTYFALLGMLALWLVNAIRVRGGDYEGVIRPTRRRETPFANLRHALAAAFLEESQLGPTGREPAGVEATHALPQGVCLEGRISVVPTRNGSSRAQGESQLLSRLAVHEALATARVGQRHFADADGNIITDADGKPVAEPGKERLSPVHLELLRLVLVGENRGVAIIEKHSIVPAVEELPVKVALARLRRLRFPGAPATEQEAKILLRQAAQAVTDQLFVCGLIPPPQDRQRRGAPRGPAVNPFGHPGAS